MDASAQLEPAGALHPSVRPLVVVVGNPNVGKTSLFNLLTGQNARVGNYPGITVERRSGTVRLAGPPGAADLEAELVDIPGTYSLSARSAEEQLAIDAILGLNGNPPPALVVLVLDAGQLARNLYLAVQLAELRVPFLIALNMIDETRANPPDPVALAATLGVPCVATSARTGTGMLELRHAVFAALAHPPHPRVTVPYPAALRQDVDRVAAALPDAWRAPGREHALALWALTSLDDGDELRGIDPALRERVRQVRAAAAERDIDEETVAARYSFIDAAVPALYRSVDTHPRKHPLSERVDRVLLHPVAGFLVFITVMLGVFHALFAGADPAIALIERAFGGMADLARAYLPDGWLRDALTEGVISGVGNVVVFLPQILLLFLFIGLLEDSGYMARVAFLMDRVMNVLGLHGRSFVPMLSGFACAVPAILATRTMERQRDRLLTMMVVPLMTCSARLPVYTLVIGALLPPEAATATMVGMYVLSIVMTLLAAAVLGRTVIRGRRMPLILELPPYRLPSLPSVLHMMRERAMGFLREAGTVILACTLVLWALLSVPAPGAPLITGDGPAEHALRLEHSVAGTIGRTLEPALEPLGFDWRIGVALFGAFAAREVFVSTMALVFGVGDVDEEALPLRERIRAEVRPDGSRAYRPLTGLSLLVFFALACQCMSTLAVVRRETRTWRWPAFLFGYMTALAWLCSFAVWQVGTRLGF
ncbi:MAG: ferrous iron transport protein B [Deltaproteobacteria bacterium]|nr:ferrous iron transport protein B [Deltaproteobacteria bacterium]